MSDERDNIIAPVLLAAAAAYFGFEKKGALLGDLAKEAVVRVINDQRQPRRELHPMDADARLLPGRRPRALRAGRPRKKK